MKVVALELPHLFGDPERQLARLAAALREVEPGSLVLLPECALTGYVSPQGRFDPTPWGEREGGPLGQACASLAKLHTIHLLAPLVERDGVHVENRLVWFDPSGDRRGHYGKRHPWYPERWATPGAQDFPTWKIEELRCVPVICFDVHFVAEEATGVLQACDLLLFSSAWVEEPGSGDSRGPILSGLAARFGCAIANANWGLGPPLVPGQGRSRILGPDGAQLAAQLPDGSVTATIGPRAPPTSR